MGDFKLPDRTAAEQAARGCPVLIGSALARSRACDVRDVFGIEDFYGKLNGNGTI
jgi:hypothetical protein